jgi:hypothetical protein
MEAEGSVNTGGSEKVGEMRIDCYSTRLFRQLVRRLIMRLTAPAIERDFAQTKARLDPNVFGRLEVYGNSLSVLMSLEDSSTWKSRSRTGLT